MVIVAFVAVTEKTFQGHGRDFADVVLLIVVEISGRTNHLVVMYRDKNTESHIQSSLEH